MTRTRFDQFGKQMVRTAVAPRGPVETDAEVPADTRRIDRPMNGWPSGIYEGPPLLWTRLVVVSELPVARDTLLLRLLGAGRVLKQAIEPTLYAWLKLAGTRGADEIAAAIHAYRAS